VQLGKFCRVVSENLRLWAEFAAVQKWYSALIAAQKCSNQPENWQFF
jgi:hypothetical protein